MTDGNLTGRARLNLKALEGVQEQETPGKQIVIEEEAGGILFRLVSSGAVLVNATEDEDAFHCVINPDGRDNYKCHLRDGVFTYARGFREKHWQKTVVGGFEGVHGPQERRIGLHMLGRVIDVGSSTFRQVSLSPDLLNNMIGMANNWIQQAEEREAKAQAERDELIHKFNERGLRIEKLTEELDDLKFIAEQKEKMAAHGSYTDSDGNRWRFFRSNGVAFAALGYEAGKSSVDVVTLDSPMISEVENALRAWEEETDE